MDIVTESKMAIAYDSKLDTSYGMSAKGVVTICILYWKGAPSNQNITVTNYYSLLHVHDGTNICCQLKVLLLFI